MLFLCLKMRAQIWDALARWPTVARLPSGLAHGRRTPEAPGSNPGDVCLSPIGGHALYYLFVCVGVAFLLEALQALEDGVRDRSLPKTRV